MVMRLEMFAAAFSEHSFLLIKLKFLLKKSYRIWSKPSRLVGNELDCRITKVVYFSALLGKRVVATLSLDVHTKYITVNILILNIDK